MECFVFLFELLRNTCFAQLLFSFRIMSVYCPFKQVAECEHNSINPQKGCFKLLCPASPPPHKMPTFADAQDFPQGHFMVLALHS